MDDLIKSCYQILGLQPGASKEEIHEGFKKIKDELGARAEAWESLKEASWAYETLIKGMPDTRETDLQEKDKALSETYKDDEGSDVFCLKEFLFSVDDKINPFFIVGRALVYLILLVWGFKYIANTVESNYAAESFLHNVSLPFHEAGHIIFSPFGDFMCVLGGSLMQLMIPIVCIGAFLKSKDMFSVSVGLWWLGQNFIDIAPYINDARAQELILLGGVTGQDMPGIHDWNNILGTLGLLKYDHFIAHTSHYLGIILMIASFLWGGYLLYLQWKHVDL